MIETNETNNTELIQEVINETPEITQDTQEEKKRKKSKKKSTKKSAKNQSLTPIVTKDPLEELETIKERIKNENKKIQEIDIKLDELRSNAQKKPSSKYSLSFQFQDSENYKTTEKITKNKPNILTDINSPSSRSLFVEENSISSTRKKINNIRKMNLEEIDENEYLRLKNQEKEQEKDKKFKLLREKELEIVKERKKLISQMVIVAPSSTTNKKKYVDISTELEEKRKMQEEYLLSLEKQKRKLKFSPISSAELNKFSDEVKKNEKQLKAELELKK